MRQLQHIPIDELVVHLQQASEPEKSKYAEELILRFEPTLRRAWGRGAFHIEYQDFVQDVFVRLFRGLAHLRNPKAFPGYFRTVALSVAATHARRSVPSKSTQQVEELVDRFDEKILSRVFIRSYLEELPPREREVISLAFLREIPDGEIATVLGLESSTVRAAKSRGLKRLRAVLLREAEALEKSSKK